MSDGPRVAVGAVVRDGDGRLLLVKRGADPGRGLWAVPGGRVHAGERLTDAVRREVREETGLDVEVGDLVWWGDILDRGEPPRYHFVILDFSADVVGGVLAASDDAEEARFVGLEEARRLPMPPTMFELLELLDA